MAKQANQYRKSAPERVVVERAQPAVAEAEASMAFDAAGAQEGGHEDQSESEGEPQTTVLGDDTGETLDATRIEDPVPDEPDTTGLVLMTKDGETLPVHPTCVPAHIDAGWKAVE